MIINKDELIEKIYWEGGYAYIYQSYLEDNTFQKLYNRLQELLL